VDIEREGYGILYRGGSYGIYSKNWNSLYEESWREDGFIEANKAKHAKGMRGGAQDRAARYPILILI
jgi:hypothetical protein